MNLKSASSVDTLQHIFSDREAGYETMPAAENANARERRGLFQGKLAGYGSHSYSFRQANESE